MKIFYVWSGSLKGIEAKANSPAAALDRAVRENLPCRLSNAIRISPKPSGQHPLDVYFHAPYEELFPDLFDGSLEVTVERTNIDE